MGRHKTPIERDAFKMLSLIDDVVNVMPKDRKHTTGQKIFNLALEFWDDIVVANDYSLKREVTLEGARSKLNKIEVLLKMSHEKGYISPQHYIDLSEIVERIAKQQASWYKATVNRRESD